MSVSKFPHFAVGGAVVGSVADLHLSQGVFGGLAVDEQGEVGPFACPVAISAQRLAIKAIFAVQVGVLLRHSSTTTGSWRSCAVLLQSFSAHTEIYSFETFLMVSVGVPTPSS